MGEPKPTPAGIGRIDEAMNNEMAMIYSPKAPLANRNTGPQGAKDDERAVWSDVPSSFDPTKPKGLIFLHGHNGFVTVTIVGKRIVSRLPSWIPSSRIDDAKKTDAAGMLFKLDQLTGSNLPIVLVPEVGIPNPEPPLDPATVARIRENTPVFDANDKEKDLAKKEKREPVLKPLPHPNDLPKLPFWSKESSLKTELSKQEGLGDLIDDCFVRLRGLLKLHKSSPFLTQDLKQDNLKRLFLSGHSGGGVPLDLAARSNLALGKNPHDVPISLWLLDCTYTDMRPTCRTFCEEWQKKSRLGNGPNDSCLVVITAQGNKSSNEKGTIHIIDDLKKKFPDFFTMITHNIGKVDLKNLDPTDPNWNLSALEAPLKSKPIVVIRTNAEHMNIPTVFIPFLIKISP